MKKYNLVSLLLLIVACTGSKPDNQQGFDQNSGIIIHPFTSAVMNGYPPSMENLVTLENWDSAPYNRWAYQHFRELVPTQNVSKGFGPVNYLERQPVNLDTLSFKDSNDEEITIKEMLEKTFTDGFIVLKDGKILTEQYFTGMQPSSLHLLQSASKSLTLSLLAIFLGDGKISQSGKVYEYVPELRNSGYFDAEVSHLMDMLSGVSYSFDFSDPQSELNRHMRSYLWKPRNSADKGHRDFLMSLKKERDHGERFSYKDSETEVLTWIMEKRMNRSFPQLFSEVLWSKLGVENDAFISCDGLGSPVSCGGFNIALRDFARIGQLYLSGGKLGNNQIIPTVFINDILKSADSTKFAKGAWANYFPKGTAYNNGFWIPGGHDGAFMAAGYQGQYLYIHPKFNVVIAKFSTYPEGDDSYLRNTDWKGFFAICQAVK